jgi:metal-responsive CopG/Arc/MetJ family transcriptional regulator
MRGFRMPADLEAKLDAWIERQAEPKPSRSEAIRNLLDSALGSGANPED